MTVTNLFGNNMMPKEVVICGLEKVRKKKPMIHHITNTVVMNFTANVTLCLGAAPVMAPCIKESFEMVRFAGALLLNIGTLNRKLIESMIKAGRIANAMNIPIIFDPVGVGATALRTDSAKTILNELDIAIIRGNAGEILSLMGAEGKVRGVDSMASIENRIDAVSSYALETNRIIAVTGVSDIITDGKRTVKVDNGHSMMGKVTGTGCAATTSVACFAGAVDDFFDAALGGIIALGIAGEDAAELCSGPGTFVPHFLDSLANLNSSIIEKRTEAEIL